MTVYDLADLLSWEFFRVWDRETEKDIFCGWLDDLPESIGELEVQSMDASIENGRAVICFNVDTAE